MSNTERYAPVFKLNSKEIQLNSREVQRRLVGRAQSLIEDSLESNPTVRTLAMVFIEDFNDVLADNPRINLHEGIAEAKLMSQPTRRTGHNREYEQSVELATSTLEMAAKIEMRCLTYTKALVWLNRQIKQHGRKEGAERSSRPTSTRRNARKNAKQQPHRRNANDGKRRKAA